MASDRHAITCRHCGAVLGRINRGDRNARRGVATRIVTVLPGVRVFLDLAMARVELHCPTCGACGRTLGKEAIRAVVIEEAHVA